MPLTHKGNVIRSAMEKQYGKEKGKSVFYASKNKGTISGVDAVGDAVSDSCRRYMDACAKGDANELNAARLALRGGV
jgi:hypothetical protein